MLLLLLFDVDIASDMAIDMAIVSDIAIYTVLIWISILILVLKFVFILFCVMDRRLGGASPACPTPRNREIGFVSSSFSFRACRACRACGRGEAKLRGRVSVDRCPYRWASWVLVSTCVVRASWRQYSVHRRVGFNSFGFIFCPWD